MNLPVNLEPDEMLPQNERDARIVKWLEENGRQGWIKAFLALQLHNPHVLGEFDDDELLDLLLALPLQTKPDPTAELCNILQNWSM
mmetsp:Transcript_36076/g.101602  ORF Transcript_36076/g.101602 Transcript_36076/m.101602 type:complete len:86 (-) Transcript_36076:115-372(-)|eukprot:CAMPEP_0119142292 /NCGR_PEP_ID=MMETSP1310-20130426/32386_1 /TAXON_ID=464262 /ORGANISM="Genus nov. species nov., Strain RCC2339" /LENGTH=85 /DNA_ID=CAMNT_0007133819 /DNA_START=165 /DNA_END=422 /DNA_ORIENTATION=+